MSTLFISDLHLDPSRPEILNLFHDFLARQAHEADALYILGDLFEQWIGDDLSVPTYQSTIDRLKTLSSSGTPIRIMPGNRDFLLNGYFCEASGAELITDPIVVELYGENVLLMHGDTLCTDDLDYQRFRRFAHNRLAQWVFLRLPTRLRVKIGNALRSGSSNATSQKAPEIMDVNQTEVVQEFEKHDVRWMIHGHTHRPAIHTFSIDDTNQDSNKQCSRIVLGDWYEHGSILTWNQTGPELETIHLNI